MDKIDSIIFDLDGTLWDTCPACAIAWNRVALRDFLMNIEADKFWTAHYCSTMTTKRVFSGAPWEKAVSYCRAIRSGPFVAISGTTSMKDGSIYAQGDAQAQTRRCLEIIETALSNLGLSRANIIRTRMFVTDISKWEEFGKAHADFFRDCPPATSMLEVKALISPELLIEIEADAIAP